MAKGQTLTSLYLSLGVDISELDAGFALADKTVKDAIARLNSEAAQIKLQGEIDVANLEEAGSALDKLKAKYNALSKQLEVQNQKELILRRNLEEAQKSGASEKIQQAALTNLMKQQKEVAKLTAEMRKLDAQIKTTGKSTSGFSMGGISSGIKDLLITYGPALGVTASVGAAVVALKSFTQTAIESGDEIEKAAMKYGLAKDEARDLISTLGMADVTLGDVVPYLTRMDKAVESAGNGVNETTKALDNFGISLKDENGNLLPFTEQLERLAEGYQKAAAAGRTEEFRSTVLGSRGLGMEELLAELQHYQEMSQSVSKAELLDPGQAAELKDNLSTVDKQITEIQKNIGGALIPIINEAVPGILKGLNEFNSYINNNKESIQTALEGWASAFQKIADAAIVAGKYAGQIAEAVGNQEAFEAWYEKKNPIVGEALNKVPVFDTIGNLGLRAFYNDEFEAAMQEQRDAAAEKKAETDRKYNEKVAQNQASAEARRSEAEREANEKRLSDLAATTDKMSDIWRTGLEQRLAAIDKEKKAWIEKGVAEVDATKWAEQAKVDAVVNRNRAVMTQEREALNAYLTGGIQGLEAYQMKKDDYIGQLDVNTLNAFDAAKKAVLQKMYGGGLSGADGGMSNLQTPIQQTADYTKALYELAANGIKTDIEEATITTAINNSGAASAWDSPEIQNYLHDGMAPGAGSGYFDPGATMEIIRGTQSNLTDAQKALRNGQGMEIIRGTQSSYDKLQGAGEMGEVNASLRRILSQMQVNQRSGGDVNVNVNIDTAVTQDSAGMTQLADAVADRITPAVQAAVGGGSNGY